MGQPEWVLVLLSWFCSQVSLLARGTAVAHDLTGFLALFRWEARIGRRTFTLATLGSKCVFRGLQHGGVGVCFVAL